MEQLRSRKIVMIVLAVLGAALLIAGTAFLTFTLLRRFARKETREPETLFTEEAAVELPADWRAKVQPRDLIVSLQLSETNWQRNRVYSYNHAGLIVQDGEYAYEYNEAGALLKKALIERRPDWPEFPGGEAQEREYDAQGRLIRFGRYGGQDEWFVSAYTYDAENRIATETMMTYRGPEAESPDRTDTYTHSYSNEADGTVIDTQTSDDGKQYRTVMKDGKVLSDREKEWFRDVVYEYRYESPQYVVRADRCTTAGMEGETIRLLILDSVGAVIDSIQLGDDAQLVFDKKGRLSTIQDEDGKTILSLSFNDKNVIGEAGATAAITTAAAASTAAPQSQPQTTAPVTTTQPQPRDLELADVSGFPDCQITGYFANVIKDFDQDGNDEMIAFYLDSNDDYALYIDLLEAEDGSWQQVDRLYSENKISLVYLGNGQVTAYACAEADGVSFHRNSASWGASSWNSEDLRVKVEDHHLVYVFDFYENVFPRYNQSDYREEISGMVYGGVSEYNEAKQSAGVRIYYHELSERNELLPEELFVLFRSNWSKGEEGYFYVSQ